MSDMPEQDFQALQPYLQPQILSEDPEFFGGSMEEDFLPNMLDQEDSHPGQTVPFAWETEADIQLFNEPLPDLSRGLYDGLDTSSDKENGRAVQEEPILGEHDNEFEYHEHQDSNREAPYVSASQYQFQDRSSFYGTAPEYHSSYRSDYASLGYVPAGNEQHQSYGGNPAASGLAQYQASSCGPAPTAAGQISSRSTRRARKPAAQSIAPPKEKKPVKQSKKKSLAEVRDSQSGLLWRPSPDQQWVQAVYHNDIWTELLDWTDQVAVSNGEYDYLPAKGIERWNRTAFCLAQKSWARERSSRPAILFYIQKTDVADSPKPQDFIWNNRRVIDRDNLGMRWFDDLPATISSAIEDFRLDAIQKLNPNIEWEDIWGRTPNEFRTGKEPGIRTRPALTVPALSNRTLRFRREAGTLAWDRKDEIGNEIALEFFQVLMGEECIRDNNTYAFGRDLRPEEVDRLDEYLRVEKLPERAQARRLRAATRVAAQRQAQAGPNTLQNAQQAPSVYHNAQQPTLQAQHPQASIQRAPQSAANGLAHSQSRQSPAQPSRTGQSSSTSRFAASRLRQGFNGPVQNSQTSNSANHSYGTSNNNVKRSFEDTHEDRQSAAVTKRPRAPDPGPVTQGTPRFIHDSANAQLVQPRPFNPLKRSDVLSPNGVSRGAQMQAFDNNAAPLSTNSAHSVGHANKANRKRAHEESDDEEEEEDNSTQYKKARIEQSSISQASGTRRVRRPAQSAWRPSQALSRSVGARLGYPRAHLRPANGFRAHGDPTNASRANSRFSTPAPNNGYMDIPISVPVGSEIVVKPRNQTYNLVGMAIPGQNIDWKIVDREASAASYGIATPMPVTKQGEGDPDWQGHRTPARSFTHMGNNHLPRTFKPASNKYNVNLTLEDIGPPPGLPADFIEEGFEPDGYEDAVQYQDQIQLDNIDLSSSTVGAPFDTAQYPNQFQLENLDFSSSTLGAPLDMTPPGENHQYGPPGTQVTGDTNIPDFEGFASSPYFGGNLAGAPEIDYFSQFDIPHYSAEELDQILNEGADNANSSSTFDPNAYADQAPTETFAFPQADTLGASASGLNGLTYEQMQSEYQDTFGRPLFDIDYPLENDIFGDINNVDFPLDYPLPPAAVADVTQITGPSTFAEGVRVVPDAGDAQGLGASSSPTQGAASGLPMAQQETPRTTIPSDPPRASEAPVDSDPPAAPQGSDPQEPDWE